MKSTKLQNLKILVEAQAYKIIYIYIYIYIFSALEIKLKRKNKFCKQKLYIFLRKLTSHCAACGTTGLFMDQERDNLEIEEIKGADIR